MICYDIKNDYNRDFFNNLGSSFGTKSILPRQNIASQPMKSTAISFRTTAQESVLQVLAVITIHRLSNYYGKAAPKNVHSSCYF